MVRAWLSWSIPAMASIRRSFRPPRPLRHSPIERGAPMSARNTFFAAGLTLFAAATPALAQQQGEALVSKAMCYACHQLEGASIGPPWRAIAARYQSRKDVMADVLVSKIMRGGGGSWGLVPMVPNQRVNEDEARIMADWVLA